jgi:hypothetical protein
VGDCVDRHAAEGAQPPSPATAISSDVRDVRKGPLVLADNTSIEWSKVWKQEDTDRWRKANGLCGRVEGESMALVAGGHIVALP